MLFFDQKIKIIGVLSDTHLHKVEDGVALAERLCNGVFADVDLLLHAGDHTLAELEYCFHPLPFVSVRGNMDAALQHLPQGRVIVVDRFRIGLIHGWGAPTGLEERVQSFFVGAQLDVLVYGHSHWPLCRYAESLLLLNPGSATDKRKAPAHSVAKMVLDHAEHRISAKIHYLD